MPDGVRFHSPDLAKQLTKLRAQGEDLRGAVPLAAEALLAAVDDVFEKEGPGWAPLAPATIAARRGGGGGAKILQDTAVLINSIDAEQGADFVEVGTNVPYAKFHVTGTKNMPQRDFLEIDFEAVSTEIAEMVLMSVVR